MSHTETNQIWPFDIIICTVNWRKILSTIRCTHSHTHIHTRPSPGHVGRPSAQHSRGASWASRQQGQRDSHGCGHGLGGSVSVLRLATAGWWNRYSHWGRLLAGGCEQPYLVRRDTVVTPTPLHGTDINRCTLSCLWTCRNMAVIFTTETDWDATQSSLV